MAPVTTRIVLEWHEVWAGAIVGLSRQISAMARNYESSAEWRWDAHIEGACAEMAFAKASGMYWSHSVNTFRKGGDVGDIQVRHSKYPNASLVLSEKDRDTDVFVLVVGAIPQFDVIGWTTGEYAKSIATQTKDCLYYLDPRCLTPLSELLRE